MKAFTGYGELPELKTEALRVVELWAKVGDGTKG
jgi:hypothetical protein